MTYEAWLERAFLLVESRLAEELADPLRRSISEEYVRLALIRGLLIANMSEAHRVRMEQPVSFHGAKCVTHANPIKGKGRALACDIRVDPASTGGKAMSCELKWLKNRKNGPTDRSAELMQDLWKLALDRSTGTKLSSYLLVGGDADSFSATLAGLRALGPDLRWSPAGRRAKTWPTPKTFSFGARFGATVGPLKTLLRRNKGHTRHPPECWWTVRLCLRQRWFRTLSDGSSWRAALWELDHRALKADMIDWNPTLINFGITC